MTPHRLFRPLVALSVAVSLLGAGSALAAPKKVVLGKNLVVNASFEESTNDTATVNQIPVLPVGWTFEGSTVLFDYNQRTAQSGKRNAAISGALGGGKQFCDQSSGEDKCAPNAAYPATHAIDEGTNKRYSMRPFWVTDKAIPVKAGTTYRFSAFAGMPSLNPNAGTPGEGAATQIRWVDASGAGIAISQGGTLVKGAKRILGFKLVTADLKAPEGAVGAKLMLGFTDYSHTGTQIAFDDVSFQTVN